jgi:hypothetical protein
VIPRSGLTDDPKHISTVYDRPPLPMLPSVPGINKKHFFILIVMVVYICQP